MSLGLKESKSWVTHREDIINLVLWKDQYIFTDLCGSFRLYPCRTRDTFRDFIFILVISATSACMSA